MKEVVNLWWQVKEYWAQNWCLWKITLQSWTLCSPAHSSVCLLPRFLGDRLEKHFHGNPKHLPWYSPLNSTANWNRNPQLIACSPSSLTCQWYFPLNSSSTGFSSSSPGFLSSSISDRSTLSLGLISKLNWLILSSRIVCLQMWIALRIWKYIGYRIWYLMRLIWNKGICIEWKCAWSMQMT